MIVVCTPPPELLIRNFKLSKYDEIKIQLRLKALICTTTLQLTKTILRKEDFVALRFDFYNLIKKPYQAGQTRLYPKDGVNINPIIVIHFPPQHIVEEAYYDQIQRLDKQNKSEVLPTQPIPSLIAGPTRIAFTIPRLTISEGIPYTIDSLLNWTHWAGIQLRVVPYAKRRPEPAGLREPGHDETMIELPYHILLSPSETQQWKISGFTANKDNKYELWHMCATTYQE